VYKFQKAKVLVMADNPSPSSIHLGWIRKRHNLILRILTCKSKSEL